MADTNNNNNNAVVVDDDDSFEDDFLDFEGSTTVETKIERLNSDNPKERLFSVTFDDFEDLPSEAGQAVKSSKFSCFGSQWQVSIYGGDMVEFYLNKRSVGRNLLAIKHVLSVCSKGGHDVIFSRHSVRRLEERNEFIRRYVEDGALVVRVGMELDHEKNFVPKNPALSIMLKLFNDENSADVVFEICEQHVQAENGRMRTKTSTTKLYHAHRLILKHHSPELSALCAASDGMTPTIISDVKPEVFRHLLYYVYGGEITAEEYVGNERDLINAADKYGVTNLKLEAEVWYVNNMAITIDNVIDNLLYAHAKNCALLKESVMDFIVENKETVLLQEQVSFQDVPGDVLKELLAAVSRRYGVDFPSRRSEKNAEKTYMKMRIQDLRQKLDSKGLDIDGSREALIARLKEHS